MLKGCDGTPVKLILDGFEPQAAIIVAPRIDQAVDIQFQTSLKEAVYAYVFGDKMGNVTLSGIAFAGRCNNEEASGLKDLFDYYKFGPEAMSGFLLSLNMSALQADARDLAMSFTMALATLPKKGGNGA